MIELAKTTKERSVFHVIGTAGHVDHGKSTLVEALTGTHPDRLKEEREREMTIDLGFAWLTLPGGEEVGIVDVPGHRDFIENMLAGVGGIDAVLFVVAADEGVMPQTREHLAILDILQVQGGVVVLTKADLVNDPDWLCLVQDDLRQVIKGTILEGVPIISVSARTRQGIPELLQALSLCLAVRPVRKDLNRPRLPVDRVFTMPGFGTIVTGTLGDGQLRVGDEIVALPRQVHGRVRGLQTHKRKEEVAFPGSRTAVNISGIDLEKVRRGDVIAHPGDYQPTRRLDVNFHLLQDVMLPLEHNTEVKLFLGAAEIVARLRLLGSEVLLPGEQGWLQLELRDPVVAVRGDRYILRRPSPGETLGGGIVVDPHPKARHKRFAEGVLASLEALAKGTPAEIIMEALFALGAATLQEVITRSNLDRKDIEQTLSEILITGQLIILDPPELVKPKPVKGKVDAHILGAPSASAEITLDVSERISQSNYAGIDHTELQNYTSASQLLPQSFVTSQGFWEQLSTRILQDVENYHHSFPLRLGMPKEELKSRLKLSPRLFNTTLRKLLVAGTLAEAGPLVLRPGYRIQFNPGQERAMKTLLEHFRAAPYAPPSIKEVILEVGEDIYNALIDLGNLVPVSAEVVFWREDYEDMVSQVRSILGTQGMVTAAEVRDHFTTSRKYALAFLEHLDALGITVRVGDARRLKE